MSDMKCPFCNQELRKISATSFLVCDNCNITGFDKLWQELIRTRKVLDKGMEHITGLNNMIESWLNLINSDLDQETKLRILKSAISAYVENKGGNNE